MGVHGDDLWARGLLHSHPRVLCNIKGRYVALKLGEANSLCELPNYLASFWRFQLKRILNHFGPDFFQLNRDGIVVFR